MAQLAVGLTHALRGNNVGAAALLRRGADRRVGNLRFCVGGGPASTWGRPHLGLHRPAATWH
ncbi:MAG: DUF309 domain-containing protein [Dermatophilaceae bacterium]